MNSVVEYDQLASDIYELIWKQIVHRKLEKALARFYTATKMHF